MDAERVMIDKGPFVLDAITLLDGVVERMQAHQQKKVAHVCLALAATPKTCIPAWYDLFIFYGKPVCYTDALSTKGGYAL